MIQPLQIAGRTLPDAAVIPRAALREDNVVWVVDDIGTLTFREVKVARMFPDVVYLSGGLKAGEMIVTSPIKVVTDGMRVRIRKKPGENAS